MVEERYCKEGGWEERDNAEGKYYKDGGCLGGRCRKVGIEGRYCKDGHTLEWPKSQTFV